MCFLKLKNVLKKRKIKKHFYHIEYCDMGGQERDLKRKRGLTAIMQLHPIASPLP